MVVEMVGMVGMVEEEAGVVVDIDEEGSAEWLVLEETEPK